MTQILTPAWETTLWDELNALSPEQQILASGEWITHMTGSLLPALSRHRRLVVLQALAEEGVDAGVLADRLGSRRTTIERLASEGRAMRRDEHDGSTDKA